LHTILPAPGPHHLYLNPQAGQIKATHFQDFSPRRRTMVQSPSPAYKHAAGLHQAEVDQSLCTFGMHDHKNPTTVCNSHAYMVHDAACTQVAASLTASMGAASLRSASTAGLDLPKHQSESTHHTRLKRLKGLTYMMSTEQGPTIPATT
jgi:hypothetical protein